jgi:hypothetical protein
MRALIFEQTADPGSLPGEGIEESGSTVIRLALLLPRSSIRTRRWWAWAITTSRAILGHVSVPGLVLFRWEAPPVDDLAHRCVVGGEPPVKAIHMRHSPRMFSVDIGAMGDGRPPCTATLQSLGWELAVATLGRAAQVDQVPRGGNRQPGRGQ